MRHPQSVEQLRQRIETFEARHWKGVVYRTTSPRYATETDVLSGLGSAKLGARWNPIGIAAVYCSIEPETALAETFAMQRYYGWPIHQALPRTMMAIEVSLQRVLDLTDGDIRQRLRISEKRFLETDWRKDVAQGIVPLTHLVGHAISEAGLEGFKIASAAGHGANLVIFPGKLLTKSKMTVVNLKNTN